MNESSVPHWSRRVLRRRHLVAVGSGVLLLSGALVLWTSQSSNSGRQVTLASEAVGGSREIVGAPASQPVPTPAGADAAPSGPSTTKTDGDAGPETGMVVVQVGSVDPPAAGLPADDEMARRLVGTWEQYRHGKRVLTVREDGTAAMDVAVDGAWSYVFGKRLKFDIAWRIEQGFLKFELTDGEPKWGLDVFVKTYGRSRVQPILELSDLRLVLKDEDEGEPNHDWKRLP